jgi:hypothetical protein
VIIDSRKKKNKTRGDAIWEELQAKGKISRVAGLD